MRTGEQEGLTIGEAASEVGLSAKALRLYESKGLLPPAQRTDAGYRLFSEDDLATLRFIRQAKALGLQLREIKDIIELQRGGKQPCERVIQLLDQHIADIDRAITDLQQLRRSLSAARRAARSSQRQGKRGVVCRIIEHAR
jgi:MerR family transcriptional regulator, copper efflux regulator